MGPLKVFIIAGEPSGDELGGLLIKSLRKFLPDASFDGVGGVMMSENGLVSRFDMSELTLMGIAEILPKYLQLKRRILETVKVIINTKPDILITVDSPDFSLRVAKLVKSKCNIRTVHYVAPTVWAWRPGRAKKMLGIIDHILALYPFEPDYMKAVGIDCDFVGHPIATDTQATDDECCLFRKRYSLQDADPLVVVLPGSRENEVEHMGPIFGSALGKLTEKLPRMKVVLPIARSVVQPVKALVSDWPLQPTMLEPNKLSLSMGIIEKKVAFRTADVALATSGSVALELAAANTPMVTAYNMHWLSRAIISRMVTTDTGNIVNLVSNTRVVPELLGKKLTSLAVIENLQSVLANPTLQHNAMQKTMTLLGRGGEDAGMRAAKAILKRLQLKT